MQQNLTEGPVTRSMLLFALPMILGNLLQQLYNVADTLIVGRCLGPDALAAVGSSYSLMTFLTSILLGLCMGSGVCFSILFGSREEEKLRESVFVSFVVIAAAAALLTVAVLALIDPILRALQIQEQIYGMTRAYVRVVFLGIPFTFLYNYFASLLRAIGNSAVPLVFLGVSAALNVVLDLMFVLVLSRGVAGAAEATVISQAVSAACIALYAFRRAPQLRPRRSELRLRRQTVGKIFSYSFLTCVQQSVMNFGILMIQGLVNSFGVDVMAAFAAAVKIDSFAYMPVQLRRGQDRPHPGGHPLRRGRRSGLLRGHLRAGVRLRRTADDHLCGAGGDRHHRHRRGVPAHRGGLLLRHRLPLPALRPLPRPGPPRHVGGAHRALPGHPCGPGLPPGPHPRHRPARHLVGHPHRLGAAGIWWAIPIGWVLADAVGLAFYRLREKGRLERLGTEKKTVPV